MKENGKWKIYYEQYDDKDNIIGRGQSVKEYTFKGNAIRAAAKTYYGLDMWWCVSKTNPFISKCSICGALFETSTVYKHVNNEPFTSNSSLQLRPHIKPSKTGYDNTIDIVDICPDCLEKIKNYITSLKTEK